MNKIAKGTIATGKFIGKAYLTMIKFGLFIMVVPYLIPFLVLPKKKSK